MGLLLRLAVVVLVVATLLGWRLNSVGCFRRVAAVDDEWTQCRVFSEVPASEDLEVSADARFAYVSVFDFARAVATGRLDGVSGGIYRLDLESDKLQRMEFDDSFSGAIAPHGVSLVGSLLYVVHHAANHTQDCVHVFRIDGLRLSLVRTVRSPLFVSPNTLAASEDGSFVLINDHDRSQLAFPIRSFLEVLFGCASEMPE